MQVDHAKERLEAQGYRVNVSCDSALRTPSHHTGAVVHSATWFWTSRYPQRPTDELAWTCIFRPVTAVSNQPFDSIYRTWCADICIRIIIFEFKNEDVRCCRSVLQWAIDGLLPVRLSFTSPILIESCCPHLLSLVEWPKRAEASKMTTLPRRSQALVKLHNLDMNVLLQYCFLMASEPWRWSSRWNYSAVDKSTYTYLEVPPLSLWGAVHGALLTSKRINTIFPCLCKGCRSVTYCPKHDKIHGGAPSRQFSIYFSHLTP